MRGIGCLALWKRGMSLTISPSTEDWQRCLQYQLLHLTFRHGLQLMKQQQMDENNRLRATLEEWSHRNAKLEQRLNQAKHRTHEPGKP